MTLKLDITYDMLRELVNQLTEEQKRALVHELTATLATSPMTTEKRQNLYHSNILTNSVKNVPSVRREDWYNDDGR